MFRWLARFMVFRFLPRRVLPILTVIELVRVVRGLRRPKYAVNEPIDSRTAPPPHLVTSPGERGTLVSAADRQEPGI
jgi:hypothetical protein